MQCARAGEMHLKTLSGTLGNCRWGSDLIEVAVEAGPPVGQAMSDEVRRSHSPTIRQSDSPSGRRNVV